MISPRSEIFELESGCTARHSLGLWPGRRGRAAGGRRAEGSCQPGVEIVIAGRMSSQRLAGASARPGCHESQAAGRAGGSCGNCHGHRRTFCDDNFHSCLRPGLTRSEAAAHWQAVTAAAAAAPCPPAGGGSGGGRVRVTVFKSSTVALTQSGWQSRRWPGPLSASGGGPAASGPQFKFGRGAGTGPLRL